MPSRVARDFAAVLNTSVAVGHINDADALTHLVGFGFPSYLASGMIEGFNGLNEGTADRSHFQTSPELLALAPPKRTFKEYINKLYQH
jgi:hypothetical protein